MRPPHPKSLPLVTALVVAVVLALTEATQVYVGLSLLGNPVPWSVPLRAAGPSWGVFLLAVAPTLRILDAFALRRAPPPTAVLRHVPVALGFTLVHLAGTAWIGEMLAPAPVGFAAHVTRLATIYFVPDLLSYAAIVGVHHALRRYADDRRREVDAARLVADLAEARMLAVRGRLRADFFFNTLNAVAGLVARGDTTRGVEALSALSALLRTSLLTDPSDRIAVEDEIELVAGYLSIQEIRFPGRVVGSVVVEADAGRARIPPLLLVQVVEAVVDVGLDGGIPFEVDVRLVELAGRTAARVEHSAPTSAGGAAMREARERLQRTPWGRPDDVTVLNGVIELRLEGSVGEAGFDRAMEAAS